MSGAGVAGSGAGAAPPRADGGDAASRQLQVTARTTTVPRTSAAAQTTPGARPAPARGRALVGTTLFVLGFSALFASYGAAFGGLGAVLLTHQRGLIQALGGLTILLGLLFAGAFDRLPAAGRILRPSLRPRAGLAGAPLVGVLFALGWAPCIRPTLTAVLTLAGATRSRRPGAVPSRRATP